MSCGRESTIPTLTLLSLPRLFFCPLVVTTGGLCAILILQKKIPPKNLSVLQPQGLKLCRCPVDFLAAQAQGMQISEKEVAFQRRACFCKRNGPAITHTTSLEKNK